MQHMSDKEFDYLFKDNFKDVEIEPSADLWAKIAPQLPTKRKRALPLMWMAAASVVVVASVMLWSVKEEKIFLQPGNANLLVAPLEVIVPVVATPNDVTETITAEVRNNVAQKKTLPTQFVSDIISEKVEQQKNNDDAVQPLFANAHLPNKKPAMATEVLNQTEVVPVETKIVYAQADIPNTEYADLTNEPSSNKRGIRNVGDLINFVVDKVDKRDKKLIKFDTDDDDNTSIIGLNVGFVKLNKRDK